MKVIVAKSDAGAEISVITNGDGLATFSAYKGGNCSKVVSETMTVKEAIKALDFAKKALENMV